MTDKFVAVVHPDVIEVFKVLGVPVPDYVIASRVIRDEPPPQYFQFTRVMDPECFDTVTP